MRAAAGAVGARRAVVRAPGRGEGGADPAAAGDLLEPGGLWPLAGAATPVLPGPTGRRGGGDLADAAGPGGGLGVAADLRGGAVARPRRCGVGCRGSPRTPSRSGPGSRGCNGMRTPGYLDTLATVRAFYLDLAEWGLDDPVRWGVWVAPCPINQEDLVRRKSVRRRKARMDSRTRERLPVLPALVEAVDRWRRESRQLLDTGRETQPGKQFTAAGKTLTRIDRQHAAADKVWVRDLDTGKPRLLNLDEEHAFWAWAVIEVFRHTGVRGEELLELSHHSLVQYRLPSTGELVPLLQIAPSKTDAERLLPID